jgi:hypothetical protein
MRLISLVVSGNVAAIARPSARKKKQQAGRTLLV